MPSRKTLNTINVTFVTFTFLTSHINFVWAPEHKNEQKLFASKLIISNISFLAKKNFSFLWENFSNTLWGEWLMLRSCRQKIKSKTLSTQIIDAKPFWLIKAMLWWIGMAKANLLLSWWRQAKRIMAKEVKLTVHKNISHYPEAGSRASSITGCAFITAVLSKRYAAH